MKRYKIQGNDSIESYMDILSEEGCGFQIKIVRHYSDWTEEKTDFLSREMFHSCLRTRYLTAV